MAKKMHLTGFMLFAPAPHMIMSWVYPRAKIRYQWYEIEYWEHIARTLERGRFDMFFFADGWAGGTNSVGVRYAIQFPNHDPVVLVSYLAAVVKKLAFAVTMSTTFYPPYMLARKLSTLDHVTKGRIGWNIVGSISSAEARNFGMESLPQHDERYDRADEYMEVCDKLWNSWDDDALLMDMERGIFADSTKIHPLNFKGKWYSVEGPMTVIPSPQRRPYLFQAGSSDRGREFAARHAECIFAAALGVEGMREFCDDIAGRAERYGRNPKDIKIIWGAQPLVARTQGEARERMHEIRARIPFEASLALMAGHFGIDLSRVDIDKPVGEIEVPGTQGMLDAYRKLKPDITFREIAKNYLSGSDDNPMVGAPEQVADCMQYLLEEGGGDGYQITPAYYAPDYYDDLINQLVPLLQKRGVLRTEYKGRTLRDYMTRE
jgi:FMN-dependent oxidoreductase (nitrilotriacetate monooxygenase family)